MLYARQDQSRTPIRIHDGPATTVTGPDAYGASAVVGTSAKFARQDHDHGLPGASGGVSPATIVTGPDTFGASAVVGSSLLYARQDHDHGLPSAPSGGTTVPPASQSLGFNGTLYTVYNSLTGVSTTYATADLAVAAAITNLSGKTGTVYLAAVGNPWTFAAQHTLPTGVSIIGENGTVITTGAGFTGLYIRSIQSSPDLRSREPFNPCQSDGRCRFRRFRPSLYPGDSHRSDHFRVPTRIPDSNRGERASGDSGWDYDCRLRFHRDREHRL